MTKQTNGTKRTIPDDIDDIDDCQRETTRRMRRDEADENGRRRGEPTISSSNSSQSSPSSALVCKGHNDPPFADAIAATLPDSDNGWKRAVFELARRLKAIVPNAALPDLKPVVHQWHSRAAERLPGITATDIWAEFVGGWGKVRTPWGHGTALDDAVAAAVEAAGDDAWTGQYDDDATRLLARVCRELQRVAGDRPFFISHATAAEIMQRTGPTAGNRLKMFVADGLLEVMRPATARQAARYRWRPEIPDLHAPNEQ